MADQLTTARRYLRHADPALAKLIDKHPDFDPRAWLKQLIPKMDAFGALLFQVVGQELSVSSARAITGRIQEAFGGRLPEPREVLDADPERLRDVGLSRRKVETLRDLARRFVIGDFSDHGFARLSDEEIETALTAIPGIGPWTVRGFLIIFLDRTDVLPIGDLALRRSIKRIYDLAQLPSTEQFQQIAERWRPYRTLAVMYLFESEYERARRRDGPSRRLGARALRWSLDTRDQDEVEKASVQCGDDPDGTRHEPAAIGADLLRRLVPMPDAIQASRRAFIAADAGEVTGPLRSSLSRGRVLVMPVEHVSGSALVKVISLHEDGWAQGLPSIDGTVLWIDGPTGRITAQVDAAALTALRTGAASGLATDLLAHPASHVLAMLGAGGQAADQVAGVCAVRPIREVRVYSRRAERSHDLCERLRSSHPGVRLTPADSPRQAVDGADVICTATRSTAPLFQIGDVQRHVHVNAIGGYRLDMREIPVELVGEAGLVVIDQLDAALAEAGDIVAALEGGSIRPEDLAEIGPLLSGPPVNSEVQHRMTVFKSVGVAAQDWSVCELAVERFRARDHR